MSVFAIVLNEPSQTAWAAVKENWPGTHFILTDRIAFVAPDENIVLTSEIAEKVGMNDDKNVLGFVMKSAANAGFNKSGLWEWMRAVE